MNAPRSTPESRVAGFFSWVAAGGRDDAEWCLTRGEAHLALSLVRGDAHLCESCGSQAVKSVVTAEDGDLWFCGDCFDIVTAEVESRG